MWNKDKDKKTIKQYKKSRETNKDKPDFALHPEQPWLASCCGGPEEPSNGW